MKKRFIAILVITATMRGQELYAQTKIAPAQYIDLYAATAVREMEESGIPILPEFPSPDDDQISQSSTSSSDAEPRIDFGVRF